jgi:hypothetical protein
LVQIKITFIVTKVTWVPIVMVLGTYCTTTPFKHTNQTVGLRIGIMMIVGQVSSTEEAKEIENITKSFVVGNRARELAQQCKKE